MASTSMGVIDIVFEQDRHKTKWSPLPNRIKIDGVSAVIGDYVILDSDIDKTIVDMESQGMSTKNITRCELLGKLMEDKLYAHHAIQDSLEISDQ